MSKVVKTVAKHVLVIGLIFMLIISLAPQVPGAIDTSSAATVSYSWPIKGSNPKGKLTDVVCHKSETSKWGKYSRSWPHMNNARYGLDFGVPIGTKVYASAEGKVTYAKNILDMERL